MTPKSSSPLAALVLALLFALAGTFAAAAQTAPAASAKPAAAAPASATPMQPDDAARALIGVLQDETARRTLIRELERLSADPAQPAAAAPQPAATKGFIGPPAPPKDPSLARELGEYTQSVARDTVAVALKVWRGLSNLGRLVDGSIEINWDRLRAQLSSLALLALVAFTTYYAGRWLAQWPVGALARIAATSPPWLRGMLLVGATLIDVAALVVALFAALAFLITATPGNRIEVIESLFVNAFVLIEAVKIGLRALFQGSRPTLRMIPLSDRTARFWSFWTARLVGYLGYGVMLVYPVVNASIGFAVGLGARLAIVISAVVFTIVFVHWNREPLGSELAAAAGRVRGGATSLVLVGMARAWHMLVTAYVVTAFLIWVTRPFDAINYMAAGTLKSILVIGVGGILLSLLSRAIEGGIRLPQEVKRALPLLENRLNLLVPSLLRVLRILILAGVVLGVLKAWDLVGIAAWIDSEAGRDLIGRIVSALVIVVVAMAMWIAATSWIEYRLSPASGRVSTARARTLFSLFRNAFTIVLVVIAAMLALSELGVDIAPLIAGAGVVGLAVGFGSQKLVQDIITGAFIQFENAMNEGDVVTVAGISGVVDRLTIRSVGIRDVNGVYHVIPFSSVDSVSNAMRGFAFHVADVSVAYRENVNEVKRLMGVAFERLMATEHGASILEPLEMNGVTAFGENALVIRGRIKTLPGQQWAVGRAYNEFIKAVFDEHHIELPFPRTAVWFGDRPSGDAAATPSRQPVSADAEVEPERPVEPEPPARDAARRRRRRSPTQTLDVPDSPRRREEEDDEGPGPDGDGDNEDR
jgi:small-conductance mechanosensitive channel